MTIGKNVDALFALAKNAEKRALEFYKTLRKRFQHHEPAAEFWLTMQKEEGLHLKHLADLHKTIPYERLNQPADPNMLDKAHRVMEFWTREHIRPIITLDDAYRVSRDLEFFEINIVFGYLIENFFDDPEKKSVIRTDLERHQARLAEPPGVFGTDEARCACKAGSI